MSGDDKSPAMAVFAALFAVIIGLGIVGLSLGVLVNAFRVKEYTPPQPLEEELVMVDDAPTAPLTAIPDSPIELPVAPLPVEEPDPVIEPPPVLEPPPPVSEAQPESDHTVAPIPDEAVNADSEPTLEDLYTKPDPEQEQVLLRDRLRISLNRVFPPYEEGERVELRRINGMLHRGLLISVGSNDVLIVDADIRERVLLRDLDYSSRLRVDAAMREALIERRLQESIQRGHL